LADFEIVQFDGCPGHAGLLKENAAAGGAETVFVLPAFWPEHCQQNGHRAFFLVRLNGDADFAFAGHIGQRHAAESPERKLAAGIDAAEIDLVARELKHVGIARVQMVHSIAVNIDQQLEDIVPGQVQIRWWKSRSI